MISCADPPCRVLFSDDTNDKIASAVRGRRLRYNGWINIQGNCVRFLEIIKI